MRPSANQLAMRDNALAALMGAMSGSDFGRDHAFGEDYEDEFGLEAPPAAPHVRPAPPGHMAVHAPRHPAFHPNNHHHVMALWNERHHRHTRRRSREILLDPNEGSETKVERYSFSLSFALVLGTPVGIFTTQNPETTIRPQRVIMNAPAPGFVTVTDLKVANVSVIIGDVEDAYNYNANAVGSMLDMPTLEPANRATMLGNYTGFTPFPYTLTQAYTFTVSFQGPSTMAG